MGVVDEVGRVARRALQLERASTAGRINALGMIIGLAVMAGGGLFNFIEVIVRIWKPNYTTGMPSVITLFLIFVMLTVLCVLILALLETDQRH